jgi:hypothetical protein
MFICGKLIKMSNKEACVVVIDAHQSMNKLFAGGQQTRFSLAIDSLKMLLQQKVRIHHIDYH